MDNTFDAQMDNGIRNRNLQRGVAPKPIRSGSEMQGKSIIGADGSLQSDGHLRMNAAGARSSRAIAPAAVRGAHKGPVTPSAAEIASMAAANDAAVASKIAKVSARARDTSGKYTMPDDVIVDNGTIRPIEWRQVSISPPHYTPFFWDGNQLWDVLWAKGAWRKINLMPHSQHAAYTINGTPRLVRLTNCTYDPIVD